MNRAVASGLLILIGAARIAAQTPATRALPDALPADARPDMVVMSADGARSYFVSANGDVSLYERARKITTRVTGGPVWDINLAPTGDAIAYTKVGDRRKEQFVWVQPLDPRTGLAAGAERRLSQHQGDVPSISPDGRSVAFARDDSSGVGQSVVVVPIAGGAERVVAGGLPSSVANIRWTPDGRSLYFGVNPPVACVPEWSCLPLAQPYRQPPGTIRRASISGGAPAVVATARGLSPGLSPDGTTLVYIDTGSTRRWVVADANGQRRDAVALPQGQAPFGWLGGSTVLIGSGGRVRRLRSVGLADGQSRVLLETVDQVAEPAWAPDGKSFSLVARTGVKSELRIMSAEGALQKTIALPEPFVNGSTWSPDRRWIAYTGYVEDGPPHVAAVEVATGNVVQLLKLAGNESSANTRWLADSRSVVVSELLAAPAKPRGVAFRQVTLDGKATLLRQATLGETPSGGTAIDDRTAIIVRAKPNDYRVLRLTGDSVERSIMPEAAGFVSGPALSVDGSWMAVRRNPRGASNAQMDVLELLRTDGSARTTIQLPFFIAPGTGMQVVNGGAEVVLLENRRVDVEPGVYLVTAATKSAKKLFSYTAQNGPPPEMSVSPMGRTLLYLAWETLPPALLALDLGASRGSK